MEVRNEGIHVPFSLPHPIQAASACRGSIAGDVIVGSAGMAFASATLTMADNSVKGNWKTMFGRESTRVTKQRASRVDRLTDTRHLYNDFR